MSSQQHRNAAHQSAVSDILSARRKALEWIVKLSIADNIDWNSPIVNDNTTRFRQHPQRPAHAYTLLYAHNVANKSYWPKEKDLFTEDLSLPTGEVYEITVPDEDEITVFTQNGNPDTVSIDLAEVETTTETVSLETLNHKWEDRQITVYVDSQSPYFEGSVSKRLVDLWLPPKAISLAFKQLDELAASLEFLADAKDELPVYGFEEVEQDEQ